MKLKIRLFTALFFLARVNLKFGVDQLAYSDGNRDEKRIPTTDSWSSIYF